MARPSTIPTRIKDLERHFIPTPGFLSYPLHITEGMRIQGVLDPSSLEPYERQRIHRAWRAYCGR